MLQSDLEVENKNQSYFVIPSRFPDHTNCAAARLKLFRIQLAKSTKKTISRLFILKSRNTSFFMNPRTCFLNIVYRKPRLRNNSKSDCNSSIKQPQLNSEDCLANACLSKSLCWATHFSPLECCTNQIWVSGRREENGIPPKFILRNEVCLWEIQESPSFLGF